MFVASQLQVSNPAMGSNPIHGRVFTGGNASVFCRYNIRLPLRRLSPLTLRSMKEPAAPFPPLGSASRETFEPSVSSRLMESVGLPPLKPSQGTLTQRHIVLLNVIACATAVSATWLFFAAIPAILAFKKAAESLAKLMDVTREELPDTMAAIRLSGMEISDLTMTLSDLGQDITRGVRNSTQAVRSTEEKLRRLTNTGPVASMQEGPVHQNKMHQTGPTVARAARNLREGVIKGRSLWQMVFTIIRYSQIVSSYLLKRTKQ